MGSFRGIFFLISETASFREKCALYPDSTVIFTTIIPVKMDTETPILLLNVVRLGKLQNVHFRSFKITLLQGVQKWGQWVNAKRTRSRLSQPEWSVIKRKYKMETRSRPRWKTCSCAWCLHQIASSLKGDALKKPFLNLICRFRTRWRPLFA